MSELSITFGFARRQTPSSRFSHTDLSEAKVIELVKANWHRMRPTYRPYNKETGVCDRYGLPFGGVIGVLVEPAGFYSSTCTLKEGDKLIGVFERRKPDEDPRKAVGVVGGQKIPAKSVEIILYHAKVLAEEIDREYTHDWEVVSINASPTEEPEPIPAGALLANHFGLSGGTATGLSDSEFVAKLRESILYWRDKAPAADLTEWLAEGFKRPPWSKGTFSEVP